MNNNNNVIIIIITYKINLKKKVQKQFGKVDLAI